jgi:hypothetical protein
MPKRVKKEMMSRKEEINDLKRQVDNFNKKIEKLEKDSEVEESEEAEKEVVFEKKSGSYLGLLVFLIIVLLIVDVASVVVYYKPHIDFSWLKPSGNSIKDNTQALKCSDGTFYNQCSKNKPYYCYNGQLSKNAYTCGCPAGYNINFQDCKKI